MRGFSRTVCMLVLAMMLGGCAGAGQLASRGCRGSSAPELWTVQPGDVLQGVVGDTRGQPIVGAHVHMLPLGANSAAVEREAHTGGHGAFAVDSVPSGRYLARAGAPGHGAWADTVELAYGRGTVPRIQLCTGP
jgi:hypothetical protein